jgi:putative aldouronate transport system permease protein
MVSKFSQFLIYYSLLLFSLSIIMPLVYMIAVSLTNETTLASMSFRQLSFDAYKVILTSDNRVLNAFQMSIIRTVLGTALNMLFSTMLAYSLSKRGMPGRKAMMLYIVVTMVFSGGLIPAYITVTSLSLNNTIWALIVPTLISAYNVILLRNFFMELPDGLEESAKIDGASDLLVLVRIVLPLSKPVLATISLFYAVYHWNEWFNVVLYVRDANMWPLQVFLRKIPRCRPYRRKRSRCPP